MCVPIGTDGYAMNRKKRKGGIEGWMEERTAQRAAPLTGRTSKSGGPHHHRFPRKAEDKILRTRGELYTVAYWA